MALQPDRWQPGGDIYSAVSDKFGQAIADQLATAVANGDNYTVNDLLASTRYGSGPGQTTTLGEFVRLITTQPLDAPLAALDSGVKKIFDSSGVKTIIVVGIVGVIALVIVNQQLK